MNHYAYFIELQPKTAQILLNFDNIGRVRKCEFWISNLTAELQLIIVLLCEEYKIWYKSHYDFWRFNKLEYFYKCVLFCDCLSIYARNLYLCCNLFMTMLCFTQILLLISWFCRSDGFFVVHVNLRIPLYPFVDYIVMFFASNFFSTSTSQNVERTFQLSRAHRESLQRAEYDLQVGFCSRFS